MFLNLLFFRHLSAITGVMISIITYSHCFEGDKFSLEFESENLTCSPLTVNHLEAAKEVDSSDHSYVSITQREDNGASINDVFSAQESALKDLDISKLRALDRLYCGVFKKTTGNLIGIFLIRDFYPDHYSQENVHKHFLSTDAKFHKDYQGRGYATEIKKALLSHYQNVGLIPKNLQDKEASVFLGFRGLIHLTNKASMKYNILNCGYKVGRLFGDRVEIFYPFVIAGKEGDPLYSSYDPLLHDEIEPYLKGYLSRNIDTGSAEEFLRKTSLKNLLSVESSRFPEVLEDESTFIIVTIANFPILFDSVSTNFLTIIKNSLLSSEKKDQILQCEEEVQPEFIQKYRDYVQTFYRAEENISKLLEKEAPSCIRTGE